MTKEMTKDLVKIEQETQISQETSKNLKTVFMPFFEEAKNFEQQAKAIEVTSEDQVDEMEKAREVRLHLKRLRCDAEKKRKEMKAESLRKGKAIDGMANIIKYLIVPLEEHLKEQEDFAKIKREKERQERLNQRLEKLSDYETDPGMYNLGDMSDENFQSLIDTLEKQKEEARQAELREEQERIEKEKKQAEERERIRKENERLKKEKEEREKRSRLEEKKRKKEEEKRRKKEEAERKKQEQKLRKEREERAKIERELRKKAERERKQKEEEAKRQKEKELAPDKKKLELLSVDISKIELPKMKSQEGKAVIKEVVGKINDLSAYIKEESVNL